MLNIKEVHTCKYAVHTNCDDFFHFHPTYLPWRACGVRGLKRYVFIAPMKQLAFHGADKHFYKWFGCRSPAATHAHMSTFMGRQKERQEHLYRTHWIFHDPACAPIARHTLLYRWLRIDSIFQALLSATPSATRHSGWGATDFVVSPLNGRRFVAIYQRSDRRLWNLIDLSTETLRREVNFKKLSAGFSDCFCLRWAIVFSTQPNFVEFEVFLWRDIKKQLRKINFFCI